MKPTIIERKSTMETTFALSRFTPPLRYQICNRQQRQNFDRIGCNIVIKTFHAVIVLSIATKELKVLGQKGRTEKKEHRVRL